MDKNFQNSEGCAMVKEKSQERADMNIRLRQREEVKTLFSDIRHNPKKYLFIHYSSEDINENSGVAKSFSVCISHIDESGIKTFSVLDEALIRKIKVEDIGNNYDMLELEMLKKFFEYIKAFDPKYHILLHWNMKNSSYGFDALTLRYQILSNDDAYNTLFDEFTKIDISSELIKLFGTNYTEKEEKTADNINHKSKGRIDYLIEKNSLNSPAAKKFTKSLLNEGKFQELHISFYARYEAILHIIIYALEGRLKTNRNIIDRYGFNPAGIFEAIKDDWKLAFVAAAFWLFIAIIVEKLFFS